VIPAAGDQRQDRGRVRIPADVDRPDRILAGLTARQLVILAVGALVLWAGYVATRHMIPLPAYGAAALPVAAVVATLALGRMEGVPADRWVAAALRHRSAPRRLVVAPDGIPVPPALLGDAGGTPPAALRLPVAGITGDGVVDLGAEGMAVVCRASAVTFSLRTPGEQEALVAGFARFLSSLAEPVQVLVRSAPLDVAPAIDALTGAAGGLPHVALERAARDHARFLADLAQSRTLLRREVLVVLRQPGGEDAAGRLRRRAAEATAALAAAGVALQVLDGPGAAALLASCLDPAAQAYPSVAAWGAADDPITFAASAASAATPPAGQTGQTGQTGQEGASR
jgi:hypothetical protein